MILLYIGKKKKVITQKKMKSVLAIYHKIIRIILARGTCGTHCEKFYKVKKGQKKCLHLKTLTAMRFF